MTTTDTPFPVSGCSVTTQKVARLGILSINILAMLSYVTEEKLYPLLATDTAHPRQAPT
jgi:hypothetical protein